MRTLRAYAGMLLITAAAVLPWACSPGMNDGGTDSSGGSDISEDSQSVGDAGGTVRSSSGDATVSFPSGALTGDTMVTVVVRQPQDHEASPALRSPVIDITLDPAPTEVLSSLASLTIADGDDDPDRQIARFTEPRGQVSVLSGPSDTTPSYWMPLGTTRMDAEGNATVALGGFSRYCTVQARPACAPTEEDLAPPEAPEGFVYVGSDVVIDRVYDADRSTVPLTRADSPDDLLQVRSRTVVTDGTTTCDVLVIHRFAPAAAADNSCEVPEEWLVPVFPDPAECYRHLGYSVVVNFVMTENTLDLRRTPRDTDVTHIRSETIVLDHETVCDIIVGHDFELIEGKDDGGDGDPDDGRDDGDPSGEEDVQSRSSPTGAFVVTYPQTADADELLDLCARQPSDEFAAGVDHRDFDLADVQLQDYIPGDGTDLAEFAPQREDLFSGPRVRGVLRLDGNASADLPGCAGIVTWLGGTGGVGLAAAVLQPGQVSVISGDAEAEVQYLRPLNHTRGNELEFPSVFIPAPSGFVAVVDLSSQWTPSEESLAPPEPPAGYRYMGRLVVIDSVLEPAWSTLDLDRGPADSDIVQIKSETQVQDGTTTCDVIVAHVFEPEQNDQRCVVPPELLEAPPTPPGYRYVGVDVVVNNVLVQTTVDLTRPDRPSDVHAIRSQTTVEDATVVCDIIVRHLFEKID